MGKMKKQGKEKKVAAINKRVQEIRAALNMTQQGFADAIKFKTGNTLSMIERGENKVSEQHIVLICAPNCLQVGKTVNADWLRTGNGKMFVEPADGLPELFEDDKPLPIDEKELIGVYRELIPENKEYVRDSADKILQAQKNTMAHLRGKPAASTEKGDLKISG